MKKALIVILAVVAVGALVYVLTQNKSIENASTVSDNTSITSDENGRRMDPGTTEEQPVGKLKVANFSGKLQKVDTGCFADGECYVEVDGKHITVLMGWSQAVVGSVKGVEGFGDLVNFIGIDMEVYAQDKGDGTYTLYGNEGFYIRALFDY